MAYAKLTDIHRRRFLKLSAAAATLPSLSISGWAAGSETHSAMIGDVKLTVLSDGHLTLPSSALAPGAPPAELKSFLTKRMGSFPTKIKAGTNHALLRVRNDIILIDSGSGNKYEPTAGKLLDNLRMNGVDPAAITKVIFTHAHPDHIWGTLLENDTLALPNATYYVGESEFKFWTDPMTEASLPKDFKAFAIGARRDLLAVRNRLQFVKEGDSIASSVSVLDTPGHTPGHISVLIEGGSGLVVGGDAIASEFVSVERPDWAFGFDSQPELAIATRKRLLDRIATDGHRILGYHFAYPGIGHIKKSSGGYRYSSA